MYDLMFSLCIYPLNLFSPFSPFPFLEVIPDWSKSPSHLLLVIAGPLLAATHCRGRELLGTSPPSSEGAGSGGFSLQRTDHINI